MAKFSKLGGDYGNSLAPFAVARSISNRSSPEQPVNMGKLEMWQSPLNSPGLFYRAIKLIELVFWLLALLLD